MKAISGRQPWWWAILYAGKRIENRKWNTHYRGPILLHAAKGCTRVEFREAMDWMMRAKLFEPGLFVPSLPDMKRGGIVGRARLVDVIRPWVPELRVGGEPPGAPPFPETLAKFYPAGVDHRWHMTDRYGFVLSDVEPLPFTECPGRLGLFDVDPEVSRAARQIGLFPVIDLPSSP